MKPSSGRRQSFTQPPSLARRLVALMFSQIRVGRLTVIENGYRRTFGRGAPTATITVRDPRFWARMLRGSLGMARAYADGLWDSPDLVGVVRLAARNAYLLDRWRRRFAIVWWPLQRARAAFTRNTRTRSRRGISAHYDLGNELFGRMLDPTLSYSCAVFDLPGVSLERAAVRKLELVCQKLELTPDDHLIEIGTGWGGLATYAARTRGCRVTTTTISREQFEYASELVRRLGLQDRVRVLMEDYRDLRGRFDKLVSIEMIEAVGWQHLGTFFAKCSSLLEARGLMLLQAITIDDRAYEVEKASRSFIKTEIFPGGCLPSLEVLAREVARQTDLQIVSLDDITSHYVLTLQAWRERFERHARELEDLGYDERFRRMWRMYLAYCEAGFAERRICDVQVTLAKPLHVPRRVVVRADGPVLASSSASAGGAALRGELVAVGSPAPTRAVEPGSRSGV